MSTSCVGCQYAEWDRTRTGRLSPSGDGRCLFEWAPPPLPSSKYFFTAPIVLGGSISRRKPLREACSLYRPDGAQ